MDIEDPELRRRVKAKLDLVNHNAEALMRRPLPPFNPSFVRKLNAREKQELATQLIEYVREREKAIYEFMYTDVAALVIALEGRGAPQ